MARVVQRRTPPYLLIVFVLLFVISTVMAVLFLNKYSTAAEDLKNLRASERAIITSSLKNTGEIPAMIAKYKKDGQTVVAQLMDQNAKLTQAITGSPTSFADAEGRIEKTFNDIKPPTRRGLLTHMEEYYSQLSTKEAAIADRDSTIKQLQADIDQAGQKLTAAQGEFEQKLAGKDSQISALDQKFTALSQAQDAKLEEAKKAYDQAVDGLKKQIDALNDQLAKATRQRDVLQVQYDKLRTSIERGKMDTEKTVIRPDGKVQSVDASTGMAYLNIGSKDRVTEGLRFTVYPYTGIPKSGEGKGVVEVLNVAPDVCQARIIKQDKNTPITPGDLVANLVYDSLNNYNLLVEGNFDLSGSGQPTPAGNKAIKELIRRYGGNVANKLSIDTDFVVLGDPPAQPPKPSDTDPQDAWDLYQERLKDFNRYQQIKDSASAMKIPVISSKRFLDLIGYVPTKTKAI